jgi:hypothetical protein
MNTLTFTNDEVVPSDLEHLRDLVKTGKDYTGLIACLIEKFEAAFTVSRENLAKQIQESSQVTIYGELHNITRHVAEQCTLDSNEICLNVINEKTKKDIAFRFIELYDALTEDSIEFHKLLKLSQQTR